MKFFRLDQGIDITKLDPESNKQDYSEFVARRILAEGNYLDIRMPDYFVKVIERWESQGGC